MQIAVTFNIKINIDIIIDQYFYASFGLMIMLQLTSILKSCFHPIQVEMENQNFNFLN